MHLTSYLSQDRLRALVRGENLPDRTSGAAMLADISGFTPLTEVFEHSLGRRQGAEELTGHLNTVFTALIAAVEMYGGSVVSFAGDAIICWFDDADREAAAKAVSSAFAMQAAMRAFTAIPLPDGNTSQLYLKVAVAHGPARRFAVGDPAIGLTDTLAGETISRTAVAEHLANPGEVLVDEATATALGLALSVNEWRTDPASTVRFAVAVSLDRAVPETDLPALHESLTDDQLLAWIPAAIKMRSEAGQSAFLNEFRPCVALFVQFEGIDYEQESAEAELDDLVSKLQVIAMRYGGVLVSLTIGDKGSYVHLNFGALAAHEDDSRRAIRAALDVLATVELSFRMGIGQGLMRVGEYGGRSRRTFGVFSDDVNLAARLMTTADQGEILVSGRVYKAVRSDFSFVPHAPLPMKGKAEPLPVFAVSGERRQRSVRLQEPNYALPMVGRESELALIEEKLGLALQGNGQVLGIVAEAGLGKSRLVAEIIRSGRRMGFIGYGGACQSDSINVPYLTWKGIWNAFFDVNPDMPLRKLVRWLEGEIEDLAPARVDAVPLLNDVLDLKIPENEFTEKLEPKVRQSALHALLEDCLKASALEEPTLVVLEDVHWIDALSHDLLDQLATSLAKYAVCFVLAYRTPELSRLQEPRLEALPQFTRVELHELSTAEAESAIRAKLAQLYPARGGALPEGLVGVLMGRAQGNPFYLEELLNYLRDRGLDPAEMDKIELPDSLHTLILSRIDQLSPQQKTTLRVASIVGRLFRAGWLTGYYPDLGPFDEVKATLDELDALDITPLDSPEPDLAYLFKHIVTYEVTYESLPYVTRSHLHERLARYLESIDAAVDTIAVHYGRSENVEKKHEYLRKAGEAAQKRFANDAALGYYERLLPLIKDGNKKVEIHLQRGKVLELLGEYEEAEVDFRAALVLSERAQDMAAEAAAQFALGKLCRLRGDYETSLEWLAKAKSGYEVLPASAELGQVLTETGHVLLRKGDYPDARVALNEGLAVARHRGDLHGTAHSLIILGQTEYLQGDYAAAQPLFDEGLALWRNVGDKMGISDALNSLGAIAWAQSDFASARALWQERLALTREMGDKRGISSSLNNLANVAMSQGNYTLARAQFEESIALDRAMGDRWGVGAELYNLGIIALASGDNIKARQLLEESLAMRRDMGEKWGIAATLVELGMVALTEDDRQEARTLLDEARELCAAMDDKPIMAYALMGLGLVELAQENQGSVGEARRYIVESMEMRLEMGEQLPLTSSLTGLSRLALSEGNASRAVRLLGAIDSLLKTLDAAIEPEMLYFHAQTLSAARGQLDDVVFRKAWNEGALWSLDEAVRYALEEI